jgi:hypothetical protein
MRGAVVMMLVSAAAASAQVELPPERYGVRPDPTLYPQDTARQAVATLAALAEKKRFEYLVAHLLDPAVVDERVRQKAAAVYPAVERQLVEVRGRQRLKPADVSPDDFLSDDPQKFGQQVQDRATQAAFRAVVAEAESHLSEYPEHLAFFRRLAKDGVFAETADAAGVSLKTDPDQKLFLRKAGSRWTVEDRKADKPAPAEPKK